MGCGSSKTAEKATSDTSSVEGAYIGRPDTEDGYFSKDTEDDYLSRKESLRNASQTGAGGDRRKSRKDSRFSRESEDGRRSSEPKSRGYDSDGGQSFGSRRNSKAKDAQWREYGDEDEIAATKIQAAFRGYRTRKEFKGQKLNRRASENNRRVSKYDRSPSPQKDRRKTKKEPVNKRYDAQQRSNRAQLTQRRHSGDGRSHKRRSRDRRGYESDPETRNRHRSNRDRGRRRETNPKNRRYSRREEEAATKIQAGFRGFMTRKKLKEKQERKRHRGGRHRHRRQHGDNNYRYPHSPRNLPPPPPQRRAPEPKSPRVAGGVTRKGEPPPGWRLVPGKGNESKFHSEYVNDFYW